jgi:hypothetical protein
VRVSENVPPPPPERTFRLDEVTYDELVELLAGVNRVPTNDDVDKAGTRLHMREVIRRALGLAF